MAADDDIVWVAGLAAVGVVIGTIVLVARARAAELAQPATFPGAPTISPPIFVPGAPSPSPVVVDARLAARQRLLAATVAYQRATQALLHARQARLDMGGASHTEAQDAAVSLAERALGAAQAELDAARTADDAISQR